MFSYRLCAEKDFEIWLEMNKAFMAEEIEDDALWNNADQCDDAVFLKTFEGALGSEEMIRLIIFEEDGRPVGFANLMLIYSIWAHGKALILDDLYLKLQGQRKRVWPGRIGIYRGDCKEEWLQADPIPI